MCRATVHSWRLVAGRAARGRVRLGARRVTRMPASRWWSHENAFNRMIVGDAGLPALTGDALPASIFFTPKKEFFSNGEPVQLLYQPTAHSAGDVLVFFRASDVISAGDIFVTTSWKSTWRTAGAFKASLMD